MFCIFLFSGCAGTQPFAAQSMEAGLNHQHAVFNNVADKFAQTVLNYAAHRAAIAAENGDPEEAQKVIQDLFDEMDELGYLQIQWERGRSLLRTPQEFIWSKKSIFNILWSDWKKAEKRVVNQQAEDMVIRAQ